MNWGYKILVVYALFIAGILFLVFKSSTQKMDLVTTDYYAKELKYQQKINETERVNALSAPISCEVIANQIQIHFPKDFNGKEITGEAILYCPSDEDKDLKRPFKVKDAAVEITLPQKSHGQYELHLTWQANGINYYLEKKLFL